MSLVDDMDRYERDDKWRDEIAVIAEKYEAELAQLRAQLAQIKYPSESCKEERSAGNSGCGACALCCKELRDENEELRARVADLEKERDWEKALKEAALERADGEAADQVDLRERLSQETQAKWKAEKERDEARARLDAVGEVVKELRRYVDHPGMLMGASRSAYRDAADLLEAALKKGKST